MPEMSARDTARFTYTLSAFLRVNHQVRDLLRDAELTPTQLIVLEQLAAREPVSATVLADEVRVSAPTLTRVVDGLERRGLVERTRSGLDRRQRLVGETDSGAAMVRRARARLRERHARILAALGEHGFDAAQMLARVAEAVETVELTGAVDA